MANGMDNSNAHYKGEFASIYEVNQKYPKGGTTGDYVMIDGWAHYWNADRATWCVNEERDSYWDELMTGISSSQKSIREELGKKADTATVNAALDRIRTSISTEVQDRKDAIAAEAKAREAADAAEAQARKEGLATKADAATVNAELANVRSAISTEVQERKEAIAAEEQARAAAIEAEAQAREAADTAEAKAREAADAAEAQARKDMVSQELGEAEDMVISQKTVTENLLELQRTVFPLQVSLSLDKTLLEFTGNDQAIKVTYSVKRKDVEVTPTALGLSVNGTMFNVDLKPSDTVTVNVNKEGESTIVLTAKYSDLIKSVSAKVTMVLPIYCGFGTSETDVAIAANKLGPRTSASGTYTKTSAKDNVNFIILVPKSLPGLSSFSMGGAPFVMVTTSVVINGKDYYMYKSGGVYMSGTAVKVQAS